jgi:hypothetical protein
MPGLLISPSKTKVRSTRTCKYAETRLLSDAYCFCSKGTSEITANESMADGSGHEDAAEQPAHDAPRVGQG